MKPWESPYSPWKSQSAFYTWIRGGLRLLWKRYPIKNRFKQSHLVSLTKSQIIQHGFHRSTKKAGKCSMCEKLFPASRLEVDHIIPAGTLKSMDDFQEFVTKLLCDETNMRLVCKNCHGNITLAEKVRCPISEVWKHKSFIEFKKNKAAEKALICKRLFGVPGHNNFEREKLYHQYIFKQCKTKPKEK